MMSAWNFAGENAMRCKAGDLALVVSSSVPENNGKLVRCIRLVDAAEEGYRTDRGPIWETDTMTRSSRGKIDPFMFDCYLMPIRPLPGEPIEDITERPIEGDLRAPERGRAGSQYRRRP